MDMRSVLAKIAESLEGEISVKVSELLYRDHWHRIISLC